MRRIALCLAVCVAVTSVMAQVLSSVSIADQFDSGFRGGNTLDYGTACFAGDGQPDISDATVSNVNGASGTITYRNTFAGQCSKGGEVESPVLTVTTANTSPDWTFTLPVLPANTRPGATSPNRALYVGDDGGYNAIAFGDLGSTNYFVEVDMYCPDYSGVTGAGGANFTRMGLSVRNNYTTEPAVDGPGWFWHTTGSYALLYESSVKKFFAVKFLPQSAGNDTRNTSLDGVSPHPTVVKLGELLLPGGSGWYTLRIEAAGALVRYYVNGNQIASTIDGSYPAGAAVLHYRASGTFDGNSATDTQGVFDNLKAGPFSPPALAHDWAMYE
ncbi:MAG: hypothetical protein N2111_02410 [Candidatus Sumerlaeaceae bacterium]|nr:hypothetical protein [Candidatus Sumerlaeaceae bacterium]